jgi:MraZ protein
MAVPLHSSGELERMFLGRYAHTLDDKGRLTIPAKYRSVLAAGLVVTRGLDRCLYVYPMSEWQQLEVNVSKLPLTKEDARHFVRFLFAEATDCVPDRQGRVLLPGYLRDYARLGTDVIVAGSNSHLEVWDAASYEEENARLEQNPEAQAEKLGDLGVL